MEISYSQSMAVRSRCPHCGTKPYCGFYLPSRLSIKDVSKIRLLKNFLWKMTTKIDSFYLEDSPKKFNSIALFSKKVIHNKIGIRYHQYYGLDEKLRLDNIAYLCACFKTCWLVPLKERAHSKNRKSYKNYPLNIKVY